MKLIYQSKPKVKFQNLPIAEWKKKLFLDLQKIPNFHKAFFFGSFARGTDVPWSDVDLIILLQNIPSSTSNSFMDRMILASSYLGNYPEVEPLVYSLDQWEKIVSDPSPIGFWKDVTRDMVELVG